MNEIIDMPPVTSTALAAAPATTPSALLAMAVQQGADLDKLERLMLLQERWEKNEAAKAFAVAFADFKAKEVVKITKDKHVSYTGQKGQTDYDHATIGNVVATITEAISKYGFSHSWSTRVDAGVVWVKCILRHKQGHSEEVELPSKPDTSGGKNEIQGLGSAITYLQRYTLLAITGCATSDQADDDGAAANLAMTGLADDQVDSLIEQIKRAPNLPATMEIWEANNAKLVALPEQHARLKAAVAARREDFKALKRAAK